MNRSIRFRLIVMNIIQWAVWGSYLTSMGSYLAGVAQDELDKISSLLGVTSVKRVSTGYLNNVDLRFGNECARHKLLDVLGDFSLIGYRLKGKVIAVKSGHKINTQMARIIREKAKKEI